MNVVVLLADASQRSTHFLVLFISKLPRGDHIVGFEQSIGGHEGVLGTPVVVSETFKFKKLDQSVTHCQT